MGRIRFLVAFLLVFCASLAFGAGAYRFSDSVRDIAPAGKGLHDAVDFISMIGGPGRSFSAKPQDLEFFRFINESMRSFNFKKVYESKFLHPLQDGFRGTSFRLINANNDFHLAMTPNGAQSCLAGGLGSFSTQVALKHNPKSPVGSQSYSGYITTEFLLKQFSEKHLLRLLDNFQRVIDYNNVRALEKEHGYDWKKAGEPFEVVKDFRAAFPSFMAWADRYAQAGTSRVVTFQDHQPFTAFALGIKTRLERIRRDYPGVASRLDKLKGLARFFIVVKNPKGHVLATFIVNTGEDFFYLYVVEKDGMVIPVDVSGKEQRPVPREAFALADLSRQPFTVDVTWDSQVAGLDFKTREIKLAGNYESSPEKMLFSLTLTNVGRTKVSGMAYKIVPTWLLDLVVPGNFDEVIYDFARCMVKANKGQGSQFILDMNKKSPGENRLTLTASSEILDNFFIRFGLRVLSHKFSRDKDELKDSKRMYNDAMAALLADLGAMKGQNGK